MELIFILFALTAFAAIFFVLWLVWTLLGLVGKAAGAVFGAATGDRRDVPRLTGVAAARCRRPSCLAVNPAEANFCRRCGLPINQG